MKIIPAIDLFDGQCVRLYQGNYDKLTIYDTNPLTRVSAFSTAGATDLHIVDLNGAKAAKLCHLELIKKIVQTNNLCIQVGGGIRTKQQLVDYFELGVARVVLGSIAILNINLVKDWLDEFGPEKMTLAVDIRLDQNNEPKLALQGWQAASAMTLWSLLDEYRDTPLRHVLCTDIQRDGTLQGPNVALYKACIQRYPTLAWQASGGIRNLADLNELAAIPIAATIIGKAIYENKFSLASAINGVNAC